MTRIYFVRHAQPVHTWEEDKTRPLTSEGLNDSQNVTALLSEINVDCFYCSPYKRSIDTIIESAEYHKLEIIQDERLRERQKGIEGNNYGMFQKRWADFNYCEVGGESLGMVQERNMAALFEILTKHKNQNVVIGTHGTALSTILNYYKSDFACSDFLRIIDFMPYIIRLDFNDMDYLGYKELLIIEKVFTGKERADKT